MEHFAYFSGYSGSMQSQVNDYAGNQRVAIKQEPGTFSYEHDGQYYEDSRSEYPAIRTRLAHTKEEDFTPIGSKVWAGASVSLSSGGAMEVRPTSSDGRPLAIDFTALSPNVPSPSCTWPNIQAVQKPHPLNPYYDVTNTPNFQTVHTSHPHNSYCDVINRPSSSDGLVKVNSVDDRYSKERLVCVDKECPVKFYGKTISCVVSTRSECYISLESLWKSFFSDYISSPLLIRHYLEREKGIVWMSLPSPAQETMTCDVYAKLRDVATHMEDLQWMLTGCQPEDVSPASSDSADSALNSTCVDYCARKAPSPCFDKSKDHISGSEHEGFGRADHFETDTPLDLSLKTRAASI